MSRSATSVRVWPNKEVESELSVELPAQPPVSLAVPPAEPTAPVNGEAAGPCAARPLDTRWGDVLLRTFNEVRDELISTLWFVLGNQEDAQDVAQEVFLRCWRTQESLPDVLNLRAWIFRVGLNAAKDVQRSAWKRRGKTPGGAGRMPPGGEHSLPPRPGRGG